MADTLKYSDLKYDLMRIVFDAETNKLGKIDTLISSSKIGGSISFLKISPEGKYLMFTLADYVTLPIRHEEADLFILDLSTGKYPKMSSNSDNSDSYHQWSSNGRWFVFSSRRLDGLWTRPFFSYINENGNSSKPFVLPQKDPLFYDTFSRSYDIPEPIKGKISTDCFDFTSVILGVSIQAKFDANSIK